MSLISLFILAIILFIAFELIKFFTLGVFTLFRILFFILGGILFLVFLLFGLKILNFNIYYILGIFFIYLILRKLIKKNNNKII